MVWEFESIEEKLTKIEEVLTLTGLIIKEENLIKEAEPEMHESMHEEPNLNEIEGFSIQNEALELLVERIKSIKQLINEWERMDNVDHADS